MRRSGRGSSPPPSATGPTGATSRAAACERTRYRFDILCDYGIFRDLQRHRMLTVEWQRLSPTHGYVTPAAMADIGAEPRWREAMERAAALHAAMSADLGPNVAQYVVPLAYRIRFILDLDAREAFHLIELRSQAGGHPDYRRIAQTMHRLIAEQAGHRLIAGAMALRRPRRPRPRPARRGASRRRPPRRRRHHRSRLTWRRSRGAGRSSPRLPYQIDKGRARRHGAEELLCRAVRLGLQAVRRA